MSDSPGSGVAQPAVALLAVLGGLAALLALVVATLLDVAIVHQPWLPAAATGLVVLAGWGLWQQWRAYCGLHRLATASTRRLTGASTVGTELVWEMDPDGTLTYLGGQCVDLFGRAPAELVGTSVFTLLPPAEADRARAIVADAAANGVGWHKQVFQAIGPDGSLHPVETSGVAHVGQHGQVLGFTATTRPLSDDDLSQLRISEAKLRVERVLGDRALTTVFQPIVDLQTGATVGYEALSRFPSEPGRSPAEYFADAALVGREVDLDLLAVQTALHQAARRLAVDTYLSVNVSPATLSSPRLTAALDAAPLALDRILVEITEHVSVSDYRGLAAALDALRQRGVRLAVDDAGAGYASFQHILRLRPDCIKLDRELVRHLDRDPARRAFAAAIVMFALEVGAIVIGEGVETAEEVRTAAALGLDAVQGYYLGHPHEHPRPSTADIPATIQTRPA